MDLTIYDLHMGGAPAAEGAATPALLDLANGCSVADGIRIPIMPQGSLL
jgi:hypothetical protein